MLKALIKKQLLELFQSFFINRKTGRVRNRGSVVLLLIILFFVVAALGFGFFGLSMLLGDTILGGDNNWLYFALIGLIAIALGVFGGIFNTYASLYLPKDNELLMSLPIPPVKLLLARTLGLYLTSILYSAWVWIPALIAYRLFVPANIPNVIFPIILLFVIALFVSVLSCILGFIVAVIAAKTNGKSIIRVVISLVILGAYYIIYFKVIGSLKEVVGYLATIGDTVGTHLHYMYLIGTAADGNALSLLLAVLITAALAAVCLFILSKTLFRLSFIKNTTAVKTKVVKDYTQKKQMPALVSRELSHFTSVATWMLNGGLGLVALPVIAIVAIIKCSAVRDAMSELSAELPVLYAALPALFAAAVCFILSTNTVSSVAVSIEGKSLWILQSLPVEPWDILRSKEKMSVRLCVPPALFFVIVCGIVLELSVSDIALAAAVSLIFIPLSVDFGLFLNLKRPTLSWTNAATLTKQSLPVCISLFGGWLFCLAFAAAGFFLCMLLPPAAVLAISALVFAVLLLLLRRWLKGKGAAIFRAL